MHDVAYKELSRSEMQARWRQLLEDPDAPERCELDEYGDLIVTPLPSNEHQRIAGALGWQIKAQLGGETGVYAVATQAGVKVPDMCWTADYGALRNRGGDNPLGVAPEICVEVASPGNTRKEMNEKIEAYLQAGAREVILV